MKKNIVFLKCFLLVATTFLCVLVSSGCGNKTLSNNVYNVKCEYVASGVVGANMQFDYTCNIREGTDELKFNLFANAFRKEAEFTPIETELREYGRVDILKVFEKSDGSENILDYEIGGSDKNVLTIKLGKEIKFGEKTSVCIDFAVTLPNGNFRMSKGVSTVNLGNFYPILCVYENGEFVECEYTAIGDPFYSEVADYNVELIIPSTFVVSASTVASSCDVAGDKTKYSYSIKNARDFAFCISEKFQQLSENCGGVLINYYYFNDDECKTTFEAIKKCLAFFSEKFGSYPYSSFSVAESDFNEGGMEYPGLVYINCELDSINKIYTAVHETAHQWWYGMVGNNQLDEAFLDEGLTEYSTAVFFSENPQFNVSADRVFENAKKSCDTYKGTVTALGKEADLRMIKNLKDFDGEYHYVTIAYNRGMTMMKSVEEVLGRKKVLSLMKGYCDAYRFKIADTSGFLSQMKSASPILKSFIDGTNVN